MSYLADIYKKFSASILGFLTSQGRISMTKVHKVYLPSRSRYMVADSLRKGIMIMILGGLILPIDSIAIEYEQVEIYDISVSESYNFYAGELGVLVENAAACNLVVRSFLNNLPPNQQKVLAEPINNLEGSSKKALLEDIEASEGLREFLGKKIEGGDIPAKMQSRVNAWEVLPEGVRLNTQILEEVSQLAAKTLNGNPLDVKKLIDNGFGEVLKNIDEATAIARLQKMNQWDPNLVDDDIFDVYEKLVLDPLNARDLVKHLDLKDGVLDKVGNSAFFVKVTSLGKAFENFVESNISVLRSKILNKYPDLDINDYEVFTQVQINTGTGSQYFVADMVLVKRTVDDFGQPILDKSKVVVIESKLKEATNLTTPQGNALTKVKSSSNTFDVRSVSKQNANGFVLSNTDELVINDFIKAFSDGSGNVLSDVISLK